MKTKELQEQLVGKTFKYKDQTYFARTTKIIQGHKLAIETYTRTMVLDEREQQDIEILSAGVPREVSVKVVAKPQLNKFKEKTSKKTLVIKKKESPKTITRKHWTEHEIEVMKKKIQCVEGYDFSLPELAKLFNRPYVSVHAKFKSLEEEFKKDQKIEIGSCVENISNVGENVFQGVVVEKVKSFAKVQIVIPSTIHKFGEILAFNTERLKTIKTINCR